MIGKHRPRFQLPAKFAGHGQQAAMQNPKPFRTAKMMRLLISRGGYKISPLPGKLVRGCVRPGYFWFLHVPDDAVGVAGSEVKFPSRSWESGRGLPQSKTLRAHESHTNSRSSLALLYRTILHLTTLIGETAENNYSL
jgi:hypothetical protein